ncbi:hypothetical protein VKT23_015108 [Stygiomarasmius scandens]|uniref:NADP-dependent oxidoreductase domain-containing protein n=1 Tax=Marasmiellus scandens TaxID=2682957 RepID=A0ABR1IYM5_9AGAR
MKYVRLGTSGIKISKIILGCMTYGSPEWQSWVLPEEEGIKHIKAAYDAGINAFDTANTYSNGLSEVTLGKAIKQHNMDRDKIVVLTKLYFAVGKTTDALVMGKPKEELDAVGYVNERGLSRKACFSFISLLLL